MPYYRIDAAALAVSGATVETAHTAAEFVYDHAHGSLLLRTAKPLERQAGLSRATREAFVAAKQTIAEGAKRIPLAEPVATGATRLLAAKAWRVESFAERKARIRQTAVVAGKPALTIEFGEGRGDTVYVGRPFQWLPRLRVIEVSAMAGCAPETTTALGLVTTTAQQRPWLESQPVALPPGARTVLRFECAQWPPEKLARIDRLVFQVKTDADDGFLLVDRVRLLP